MKNQITKRRTSEELVSLNQVKPQFLKVPIAKCIYKCAMYGKNKWINKSNMQTNRMNCNGSWLRSRYDINRKLRWKRETPIFSSKCLILYRSLICVTYVQNPGSSSTGNQRSTNFPSNFHVFFSLLSLFSAQYYSLASTLTHTHIDKSMLA